MKTKGKLNKGVSSINRFRFVVGIWLTLIIIASMLSMSGCSSKGDPGVEKGKLNVQLRTWNNYSAYTQKNTNDAFIYDLVDIRAYKYEMKFTTDNISENMLESDIKWITVYKSSDMILDSERDFTFELPAGTYKGFALLQDVEFFWVLSDGTNTIEIPEHSYQNKNDNYVYDVFGFDGLYYVDGNGLLKKKNNNEKMGTSFTIKPGAELLLTVRMNFDKMSWTDNDNSGHWSEGDSHSNPTLPDGINTMADFLVKEF